MVKRCTLLFVLFLLLGSCNNEQIPADSYEEMGVSETEIRIGSSSALSGQASFLGTHYLHGALSYINEVNVTGGVAGRKLKIIALDDQYVPSKTIANTQKLLHDESVFALFNYVGTPTSVATKPIIEAARVPAFGFFTGAQALRKPVSPYLFHLRDSYDAEAEGAVSYFVDTLGLKKIGVFYQEDDFGTAVLTGIQTALQKRNLEPVITDTYIRGSMDIEDSARYINSVEVEAVMMVGTYSPLAKFIRLTHALDRHPLFHTVSFVGSEAFANEIITVQGIDEGYYKDIIVTQVVPSPLSQYSKVSMEYHTLSKNYFPEDTLNFVAFEGFLNAKLLVHALKKTGRKLTRTGFMEEMRKIKNYDLGIGKTLNYGIDDHEGIEGIYFSRLMPSKEFQIFPVNNEWR